MRVRNGADECILGCETVALEKSDQFLSLVKMNVPIRPEELEIVDKRIVIIIVRHRVGDYDKSTRP